MDSGLISDYPLACEADVVPVGLGQEQLYLRGSDGFVGRVSVLVTPLVTELVTKVARPTDPSEQMEFQVERLGIFAFLVEALDPSPRFVQPHSADGDAATDSEMLLLTR
jgi:hypothetical protein